MEKANLPTEKASEPIEEAHQPLEETMTPRLVGQHTRKLITFTEGTDVEKASSQSNDSVYKEVLSQPAANLSHRQKLIWLQKRRSAGLWVQCDACDRWRFLSNVLDSYELPKLWYCRMNPDTANADCSIPEVPIRVCEEEDLIHSEYSAGSVVWAHMPGWPWWPAIVDDCPDIEQFYWLDGFSDIPTYYHVAFFDSTEVTRSWITPENLKPYVAYKNSFKPFLKDKKYKTRLQAAMIQADDAAKLPLVDRLEKYSFVARYKGKVNTPKKVNKKNFMKHKEHLKRKFNITFQESESDHENNSASLRNTPVKNLNVIVLGKPKKTRKDVTDAVGTETVVPENLEKGNLDIVHKEITTNDTSKQPNSMAVQVGSTTATDTAMFESFDNDTSKTYVPEKESQESTQITQFNTFTSEITGFQVKITSPKSDDFDF